MPPGRGMDQHWLWSRIHSLLKTCSLVCLRQWKLIGEKVFSVHSKLLNRGEFPMTLLAICAKRGLRPSREKQVWCSRKPEPRWDSVHLHFLVVAISFVLRGSDELLVPRYPHMCVCWIQEDQVFRRKSFFFLNVKTWISSHDLRKWSQKPKETFSVECLKIQTFHLQEIHLDIQRTWQPPQNSPCFGDRWGTGMACGCLLFL